MSPQLHHVVAKTFGTACYTVNAGASFSLWFFINRRSNSIHWRQLSIFAILPIVPTLTASFLASRGFQSLCQDPQFYRELQNFIHEPAHSYKERRQILKSNPSYSKLNSSFSTFGMNIAFKTWATITGSTLFLLWSGVHLSIASRMLSRSIPAQDRPKFPSNIFRHVAEGTLIFGTGAATYTLPLLMLGLPMGYLAARFTIHHLQKTIAIGK
eukprot:gb/GECH01005305.1/.p1 GENE.gb/GECH01005305.1/~~gb/GECH01005305.1/.p1  ORF type:complete len:212 (+),score=38.99 gb/GECH01005305.1/:1-636(+)